VISAVPDSQTDRTKLTNRHKDKLEIYNVCAIKTVDGQKYFKAIRRDKMRSEQAKILTEYAEAVVEWAAARKENPEDAGDPPSKAAIATIKAGLRSAETADDLAEKLNARLETQEGEREEKQEDEQDYGDEGPEIDGKGLDDL